MIEVDGIKVHCKYDELVDLGSLLNYPKNRNHHPQGQIERLAKLYKYQGVRHPIIVDPDRGWIGAGHGRKLSAILAGMKTFPVVYQRFESDDQFHAFTVSDNASALWAELDMAGINADLADLDPSFGIDMLGIENFVLDVSDKGFDPSESIEPDKQRKLCPHCGEEL